MLLLLLIAASTTSTGPLDSSSAADPTSRWIALAVAFLPVAGSIIAAKIQAKRNPTNGPNPLVESATPRLDASQGYLERYVKHLDDQVKATEQRYEERLRAAEAKYEDLERRFLTAFQERAQTQIQLSTVTAQLEAMKADNADLRDRVHELQGRLRGRNDV